MKIMKTIGIIATAITSAIGIGAIMGAFQMSFDHFEEHWDD